MTTVAAAAAMALSLQAAGPPESTKKTVMNEPVAINFSRAAGWSGSESLELQRDGVSTFDLTFNYDGGSEIGTWQAALPATRFVHVLAPLRSSGYETLPSPSQVAPGAKLLSIGVRNAGEKAPRMRGFPQKPPPAALVPVVAALEAAIADVRRHPLRVLHGTVALRTSRVTKGAPLTVALTLSSAGTQALLTGDPRSTDPHGGSGVRLVFVSPGHEDRGIELTAADIRSPMKGSGPTARLDRGQKLELELHAKTSAPAGSYRLRVEYHSLVADDDQPELVTGTLWLDAGEVTVESGSWWKIWK